MQQATPPSPIREARLRQPLRTAGAASAVSAPAARVAGAAAILTIVFLGSLHALSPEFDPAWRMVSEYALGAHGWALSGMFIAWAVSSWALAFAIHTEVVTTGGRIGLGFLVASGVGQALASAFEMPTTMHNVAGVIGLPTLPVAALLINRSLAKNPAWSTGRKALRRSAHWPWVSLVVFVATMVLLIATYVQTGAAPSAGAVSTTLPDGVVGVNGWANRILIFAYYAWAFVIVRQTPGLRKNQ